MLALLLLIVATSLANLSLSMDLLKHVEWQ